MRASQRAGLLLAAALVLGHARADAETRVFVTNEKSDDVTVIDATTRKVVTTIPVGKRPRGVAVSPDGRRVYVTNSNSDSLSVIGTKSLAVLPAVPGGARAPGVGPQPGAAPRLRGDGKRALRPRPGPPARQSPEEDR